jgi:hypothetical protein
LQRSLVLYFPYTKRITKRMTKMFNKIAAVATIVASTCALVWIYRRNQTKATTPEAEEVVVPSTAEPVVEAVVVEPAVEASNDANDADVEMAPELSLTPGDEANEAFVDYWERLAETGHHREFDVNWGKAGRGYTGLMKSAPLPGVWCTATPEADGIIYRVDKRGVACIIYQLDGKVMYSANPEVEVLFTSIEMTVDDVQSFVNDAYKAA